jgi:iron complex outermembrane receptor protein
MKGLRAIVLIIILNFVLSISVWAQNEETIKLDEIVVTSTKYETSIKDIPASITVITSDAIKEQNMPNSDIGDLLRSVSGISLRRAYSSFPAYPNIRGVGSEATAVLVNGIPTNWEITHAIPPENIARVEILRGPASSLYGANASGGVINIITKEGGKGFNGSVSSSYGSFNTRRFATALDGTINKLGYSFAAAHEASDGTNVVTNNVLSSGHMIDDCNYEKDFFSISTNYKLNDKSKLSCLYNFNNNYYVRGRPNDRGDWDRHFLSLIYDQKFGEKIAFKGSLGYRYDDLYYNFDKGGTNYDPNLERFMDYYELPIELQLTANIGRGNTLIGGFFYNNQETDQVYYYISSGALLMKNNYKTRTMAGYIQDVWKPLDNLTFIAGLRFDSWKNYDNYFSNFTDQYPDDRTDDNLSPKLGVKYNFVDGTSIWANYGMGFKPPTSEQLYDDRTSAGYPRKANPDLKPEETHSCELGLERMFNNTLNAKVVGFYSFTEDKILSWYDKNNVWQNKNIGRSESYGVELDTELYLHENWFINANYTWNVSKIVDNPSAPEQEGNWLPFCPEHKANIGISYVRKNNYTTSAFVRYLSIQHTNDDNSKYTSNGEERYMKESFVVDLKATKHFILNSPWLKGIDLSLSLDNLFNEDYRTYYIYEDPGRVVFAEIKATF